jgi:hypothetical protein
MFVRHYNASFWFTRVVRTPENYEVEKRLIIQKFSKQYSDVIQNMCFQMWNGRVRSNVERHYLFIMPLVCLRMLLVLQFVRQRRHTNGPLSQLRKTVMKAVFHASYSSSYVF